jgi:hypothetical protein
MRCLACGIEMQLVSVVPDETVQVPGYAHHSFECPACHDTEIRLLFGREPVVAAPTVAPAPAPVPAAASPPPPPAPASAPAQNDVAARPDKPIVSSAWARAMSMLRRRHERPQEPG